MPENPGTPPFGKKRLQRKWGRSGEHKYFLVEAVTSSACRLRSSSVRIPECSLDLTTRKLVLALARAVSVAVNYMAQPR